MARIVLSGLVQDMSGSAGSYTYSKWKGLHYLRLKAATVSNPNTEKQAGIRTVFAQVARGWSSLTKEQRALFAQYAETLGFARNKEKNMGSRSLVTPLGRLMSGMNAQVGLNTALRSTGFLLVQLDTPPLYQASTPQVLTTSFDAGGINYRLQFNGTVAPVVPVLSYVQVIFKAVEKGSHKYVIGACPLAIGEDSFDHDTFPNPNIDTVRVGHGTNIQEVDWKLKYGDITTGPNHGKIIGYAQYRVITADGRVGTASATMPVIYTL